MDFDRFLNDERDALVESWRRRTLEAFPAESRRFMQGESNPFANPIGATLGKALAALYDLLRAETLDEAAATEAVDAIVSVHAIQEFSPGRGVEFPFALKAAARARLAELKATDGAVADLLAFESRIDRVGLLAFEAYLRRREKLYELRANDLKRRWAGGERLLARLEARRRERDAEEDGEGG